MKVMQRNRQTNNRVYLSMSYTSPEVTSHICSGCHQTITDKYLLKALERVWHEDCLKCSCCDCRLGEVGSSLFVKADLLLCKQDYLRLFGTPGQCAACHQPIPAFELVMRARENVYHVDCFACHHCQLRFCVGDKFYLFEDKIVCEEHCKDEQSMINCEDTFTTPNNQVLEKTLLSQDQQHTNNNTMETGIDLTLHCRNHIDTDTGAP